MMYFKDSLRLARAKLRLRRIRMFITVFVASLVFAVLVFFGLFMQGMSNSFKSFAEEGLGDRFIVQANPLFEQYNFQSDELIKELQPLHDRILADKKATAKKLGIEYSEEQDTDLPLVVVVDKSDKKEYSLNETHPDVQRVIRERIEANPKISFAAFQGLAREYNATEFYSSAQPLFPNIYFSSAASELSLITDGKEQTFDGLFSNDYGASVGISSISAGWATHDKDILKAFVLPGQNLEIGEDGSIPVVAPVSAAEEALGLKKLPSTATQQDRLERIVAIREGISGNVVELCFRNAVSTQRLGEAKQQEKDKQQRSKDADYVAPSLQYGVPNTPCGEVKILSDTRSYTEKRYAENTKIFEKQYDKITDPEQGIIRVRIVGLTPDPDYGYNFSVSAILNSFLQSTLGFGWFSPKQAIQSNELAAQVVMHEQSFVGPTNSVYYAEFATQNDAIAFAKAQECKVDLSGVNSQDFSNGDPYVQKCHSEGKYFSVFPFGSNQIAFESFRQDASGVIRYVGIGVLVVASFILMGVVGKVIADSRRETAVFRALGASRFAIVQIYSVYTLFIAFFVAIMSGIIGFFAAYIVNSMVVEELSVTAVIAYNATDIHKQFTVIGIDYMFGLIILGLIIAAAFISMALPMLANMRRNPINDMRDEA